MTEMVRISCILASNAKLSLVKIIKEFSGLGLKESKDIVDRMHSHLGVLVEFRLRSDKNIDDLISELKNIDGQFEINGGTQWRRNKNILEIGIGNEDDYYDFISEYITYKINHVHITDSINFLKGVFSKLDKNQLEIIFKNLNINDSSL